MPKTVTERNRDKESRKKAAGLHEYRIWSIGRDEQEREEVRDSLRKAADRETRNRRKTQAGKTPQTCVQATEK